MIEIRLVKDYDKKSVEVYTTTELKDMGWGRV